MKRLGIVLMATVGFAAMAQAADLPTTKAPAVAAKPNCFSSFWNWLNASASDCPLSAYGITLYGTIDVNATYLEPGRQLQPERRQDQLRRYEERQRQPVHVRLQWPEHQRHRPEDERGHPPVWVLADRRHRSGRQSVFGHVAQRAAVAGQPEPQRQRQQFPLADDELRFEPCRPVGQLAGLYRHQQPSLRYADLRPHQLAVE